MREDPVCASRDRHRCLSILSDVNYEQLRRKEGSGRGGRKFTVALLVLQTRGAADEAALGHHGLPDHCKAHGWTDGGT